MMRRLLLLLTLAILGCVPREPVVTVAEPVPEVAAPTPIMPLEQPLYEQETVRAPQVIKGTGKLINDKAIRAPKAEPAAGEAGVTLNFTNAELRDVVASVLGDTLGENFTVDPKVQGKVTLQTTRPLARDALLPTLEQVLSVNGAALVRRDGVWRVVPRDEAAKGAVLPPPGTLGFGLEVLPLRHVSVAEMTKLMEPFMPAGALVRTDPARNVLLIGGTSEERESLRELAEVFDVDWMAGMSFALIPLEAADAKGMVADLEQVFGDPVEGPLAGMVRFVPIERQNAVLVISARPDYIAKAQEWIKRFDEGSGGGGSRIYVYRVQNGRASELAQVLGNIFGAQGSGDGRPQTAPGAPRVEVKREALDPTASVAQASTGQSQAARRLNQKKQNGGASGSTATVAPSPSGYGEMRIIADERNNALVIMGSQADYRLISAALAKLDVVPLQVLIEATIAEVTLTDALQYGVQWYFQIGAGKFALVNPSNNIVPLTNAPGVPSFFISGNGARAIITALDEVTDVNVISSPQVMVLDNQTALLQVGDQVPVATGQATNINNPDFPIVSSIQFRDTGVILAVTPHVNASGLVTLDIEQEVSDVAPTAANSLAPTIQQRRIVSTVAVQSGQTIALGGLIKDANRRVDTGLPGLKDLPVLGLLFSQKENRTGRTELVVLITPRVVRNQQEARDVTLELRSRLKALKPLDARIK